MAKIDFKKTINSLKGFSRIAARHSFLSFLVSVLLASLLGGILFYKYDVLARQKEPEIAVTAVEFKENLYQKVLTEWQKRGKRFEAAKAKEYPDPFR